MFVDVFLSGMMVFETAYVHFGFLKMVAINEIQVLFFAHLDYFLKFTLMQ